MVRGETKSRVAMSLLASPSLTSRTTSRSVGVSEAQPLATARPTNSARPLQTEVNRR